MKSNKVVIISLVVISLVFLLVGCISPNNREAIDDENHATRDFVAFVKDDGLYTAVLDENFTVKQVISGEGFSHPLISRSKKYIAYQQEQSVYITDIQGKTNFEVGRLLDAKDLCWGNNEDVLYVALAEGGIISCCIADGEVYTILEKDEKERYHNLTISPDDKTIYYQKGHCTVNTDGENFEQTDGIFSVDISSAKEKVLIAAQKSTEYDMGTNPVIAQISRDGQWLYAFICPQSASTTADGVSFEAYNLINDTHNIPDGDIYLLTYPDHVLTMDDGKVILVNGGGREMSIDKRVLLYDFAKNKRYNLSQETQTAAYPSINKDYKIVAYSAFEDQRNSDKADEEIYLKRDIFIANLNNPQPVNLTNEQNFMDTAPVFLSDSQRLLFLRTDSKGEISLNVINIETKETSLVASGLSFPSNDSSHYGYYGHNDYSEIVTTLLN